MLIFQSADLKTAFSADLPLTCRRRTADLPLSLAPYIELRSIIGAPNAGALGAPSEKGGSL